MSRNCAAVRGGALDSGAPALSVSVAGGQRRDSISVDRDGLRVVSGSAAVQVWT